MAVVPDLAVSVKSCTLIGCAKPLTANGLCMMHYLRVRRTGDVGSASPTKGPDKTAKRCWACKEHHPLDAFYKNRSRPDGLANECRACHNARSKAWRDQHPERSRFHAFRGSYKHKYGITREDQARMREAQGNACAICRADFGVGPADTDHDHTTGAVRELLCHGCNVGLGSFRDDPLRLEAAAAYMRRWT